MLPCEGGECLRHFLLGQAQPGALSLEVGVRPGPLPRSAGIGVSHMATVRYQAFLDVFEYILSYNNSFYSKSVFFYSDGCFSQPARLAAV